METFGQWLRRVRKEKRMSGVELERLSGISRQYISNLERDRKTEATGKPVHPSVETVDALATALEVSLDEARSLAGYAPEKPRTKEDLFRALARLGAFELTIDGNLDELTESEYQDLYEVLETHLKLELRRIARRRTPPDKNRR